MKPRINIFLLGLLVFTPFFLAYPALDAQAVSKKEVLEKYERAVSSAEELNLYEEDILKVLPKLRLASKTILRNDLAQADRLLDETISDLQLLETKKAKSFKRGIKKEWLEIYIDLVQKFILLAFLAYLFVKWPLFGSGLKEGRLLITGKILLPFLLSLLTIPLSFLDLSRYGESAWAFFDLQVIFVTIGGLLGGLWVGCLTGILVGFFRWLMKTEFFMYAVIVMGAGLLSGIFSYWIHSFQRETKKTFVAGFAAGTLHGAVIYLPTLPWMPWYYVAFSILLLAFLEGLGVFIFFAVISIVLRETHRREMEQELLETKLLFLQSQMRPHFLFNALNAISAICRRENALQAQHLILRLSDFLRQTLKREKDQVTLEEEMSYIDSYLEIEKTRLQDRLKVEKAIEIRKESWGTKIPLLILQPLVENAVQHGINKKEEGGTLTIGLTEKNGCLQIQIEDNGVGMEASFVERLLSPLPSILSPLGGEDKERGIGIAVRNIHQRLTRLYGKDFGIKIQSQTGQGTKVTVVIPLTIRDGSRVS